MHGTSNPTGFFVSAAGRDVDASPSPHFIQYSIPGFQRNVQEMLRKNTLFLPIFPEIPHFFSFFLCRGIQLEGDLF